MLDAQAQMKQQRAQQFLMEDVDGQASQIADARSQMQQPMEEEPVEGEEEMEALENNPDDN